MERNLLSVYQKSHAREDLRVKTKGERGFFFFFYLPTFSWVISTVNTEGKMI